VAKTEYEELMLRRMDAHDDATRQNAGKLDKLAEKIEKQNDVQSARHVEVLGRLSTHDTRLAVIEHDVAVVKKDVDDNETAVVDLAVKTGEHAAAVVDDLKEEVKDGRVDKRWMVATFITLAFGLFTAGMAVAQVLKR